MTDYELDKLTRRVMLDAARLEYSSLPEEPHPFSPAFERKMKKLLRRGRHPVLYRALRGAACFLLVLLLSGCAVLAVSAEAREVFAGWVREVYENAFVYRFYGEAQGESNADTAYRLTWLPEGYREAERPDLAGMGNVLYRDDAGGLVVLAYATDPEAFSLSVYPEHATVRKTQVHGRPADLYLDEQEGNRNLIVWTEEETGQFFYVSGPQGEDELVKMAESVEKVEKTAVYRPSWVPEGYRIIHATEEDGVTFFVYRDDSGAQISFTCFKSGGAVQVAGEGVHQTVRVNGRSADLYMDRDPEEANVLVWMDASGESIFSITGILSGEELVKMAESVEKVEKTAVYRLSWVPEGYFQVSVMDLDGYGVLSYRNGEKGMLTISYEHDFEAGVLALFNGEEGVDASSVFVGEYPADLYLDRADGSANNLVWVDEDRGVFFWVAGTPDGEELIRVGESLESFPEPPPEDRQLTWVPAGYREDDRVRLAEQSHVLYQNDKGDLISFGYCRNSESVHPHVVPLGEEGLTPRTVLVNGKEADLYLEKGAANVLVWEEGGAFFSIQGYCSAEELVAMAESQEVILPDRRPSWVPEDYVLYERSFLHSKESATTIYENPKSEFIIFRCQPNETDRPFQLFPNEGSIEKQVSVNGHPADLYSNPEPGSISELCWSDGEAFYYLSGDLSDEEILKMAGSVQKLPPIPATHIPTWLPLGYRDTSSSSGLWSREAEYENEAGEQLQFRFARHGQEEEPMEECLAEIREAVAGLEGQEITVDGCPGRLYLGGRVNHLLWGVEGGEEVYWLSGPLDEELLLETARSVHGEVE